MNCYNCFYVCFKAETAVAAIQLKATEVLDNENDFREKVLILRSVLKCCDCQGKYQG